MTFLATLELVKMRMVRVEQANEFGDIWLTLAVTDADAEAAGLLEDGFDYA